MKTYSLPRKIKLRPICSKVFSKNTLTMNLKRNIAAGILTKNTQSRRIKAFLKILIMHSDNKIKTWAQVFSPTRKISSCISKLNMTCMPLILIQVQAILLVFFALDHLPFRSKIMNWNWKVHNLVTLD